MTAQLDEQTTTYPSQNIYEFLNLICNKWICSNATCEDQLDLEQPQLPQPNTEMSDLQELSAGNSA